MRRSSPRLSPRRGRHPKPCRFPALPALRHPTQPPASWAGLRRLRPPCCYLEQYTWLKQRFEAREAPFAQKQRAELAARLAGRPRGGHSAYTQGRCSSTTGILLEWRRVSSYQFRFVSIGGRKKADSSLAERVTRGRQKFLFPSILPQSAFSLRLPAESYR